MHAVKHAAAYLLSFDGVMHMHAVYECKIVPVKHAAA